MYLIEQLASTRPGEAIRLFPYGTVTRNGKTRQVTPELARRFKLPHFKPPVKLGSHKDETPAGGFLVGLEAREDGLYGLLELTDHGANALERGDYRYHSPEVVWEGVWGEDATNGQKLEGPLILGLALLHTPALGEAAALYSVQPITGTEEIETMSDEQTYTVPAGMWERFTAWFDRQLAKDEADPVPAPPTQPPPEPGAKTPAADALTAALKERDEQIEQLSARVQAMQAAQEQAGRVAAFAAQLADTPMAGDKELHTHLASLTDEQAAPIVQQFTALAKQIDESALLKSVGSSAKGDGKREAFEAAVTKAIEERKLTRAEAYNALMREQPELFREALDNE